MDTSKLREEFHKVLELYGFDYSHPDVVKKGIEFEQAVQAIK